MSTAVEDIVFLGKRLKGILELSETLTTKEALDNQVNELKNSLKNLKTDFEDMKQKAEEHTFNYEKMCEAYSKNESTLELKAQEIVANAESKAKELIQEAKDEVSSVLLEGSKKGLSVDGEIETKKSLLKTVEQDINSHTNKLSSIKKELESLRNKI